MKKTLIIAAILSFASVEVLASSTATLVCRQSGGVGHKKADAYSIQCSGMSSECKTELESQLTSKFGSLTVACEKALGGSWYWDYTRVDY
jgi:hypothetical protein